MLLLLFLLYLLFLYKLYYLHVRDVCAKRKLRTAKRRNDNNNNSIDMRVCYTPTEPGRGKRLHSPSVRFFFIPPNSRWPTDDDEQQSSGRGHRRITSSSLRTFKSAECVYL